MTFYFGKDENSADTDDNVIMVDGNGTRLLIPKNPKNRHWQKYQAWLADGNTTQSE